MQTPFDGTLFDEESCWASWSCSMFAAPGSAIYGAGRRTAVVAYSAGASTAPPRPPRRRLNSRRRHSSKQRRRSRPRQRSLRRRSPLRQRSRLRRQPTRPRRRRLRPPENEAAEARGAAVALQAGAHHRKGVQRAEGQGPGRGLAVDNVMSLTTGARARILPKGGGMHNDARKPWSQSRPPRRPLWLIAVLLAMAACARDPTPGTPAAAAEGERLMRRMSNTLRRGSGAPFHHGREPRAARRNGRQRAALLARGHPPPPGRDGDGAGRVGRQFSRRVRFLRWLDPLAPRQPTGGLGADAGARHSRRDARRRREALRASDSDR